MNLIITSTDESKQFVFQVQFSKDGNYLYTGGRKVQYFPCSILNCFSFGLFDYWKCSKQVLCYTCQFILWLHAQIFFLGNIEVFTHMISIYVRTVHSKRWLTLTHTIFLEGSLYTMLGHTQICWCCLQVRFFFSHILSNSGKLSNFCTFGDFFGPTLSYLHLENRLYRSSEHTNQRILFDIEPLGRHLCTGGQVAS